MSQYSSRLRPKNFSRADLRKEIAELVAGLKVKLEAEVTGLDESSEAVAERRAKVMAPDGYKFFAQTYFPHYLRSPEPSAFHAWCFEKLPTVVDNPKGINQVILAPRGEAKSTLVTQIFTMWCVITGRKHYCIIAMDVYAQAALMLAAIRTELEANPRLKLDFPDAVGQGSLWAEAACITRNDVRLEAKGARQKIRGRRHGEWRPDLVLLDDLENDENVRELEQRNQLESWIDKAVLNLGEASGTMDCIYVGTVLHLDAVIVRKFKNPMWRGIRFASVITWPKNMELLDKWEEVLQNFDPNDPADKERARLEADEFWGAHPEIEAGAVVSWPSVRPFKLLMELRVRIRPPAFASEQQNNPLNEEDAVFQKLTFWVNRLPDWIMLGACDPSMGKATKRRDPAAIGVGGFNRETGKLDIVEAIIMRMLPDLIIGRIIELQRQYRCLRWAFEAVQFQEFALTELVKRSAQAGVAVPATGIKPRVEKELRIMALQTHVAHGLIRFHPNHKTLNDQFTAWPLADHDDGPDMVAMLWELSQNFAGDLIDYTPAFARPDRGEDGGLGQPGLSLRREADDFIAGRFGPGGW